MLGKYKCVLQGYITSALIEVYALEC